MQEGDEKPEDGTIPVAELAMQEVLDHLRDNPIRLKDDNFFSIGGRGRYENPVSDVLAFFMRPDGQHGFGAKFLLVFLDCIGVDSSPLSFEKITVSRELALCGGRIDFFVRGLEWSLVIENKIDSGLNNPLQSYEKHSERCAAGDQYFAVLSPNGVEAPPNWISVTYREYCQGLRTALFPPGSTLTSSKWHVFANEFLDYLQTELYPMKLDSTQTSFVEKNLKQMGEIRKLLDAYSASLIGELEKGLKKFVPQFRYRVVDKLWGIECYGPVRANISTYRWRLMLQTPANEEGNAERTFRLGFWVQNVTENQLEVVRKEFCKMAHHIDSGTDLWECRFENRTQALAGLFAVAVRLAEISKE